MPVEITDWDPSEYLDDEESIRAYLNAAFEDGDPKLIASAIGDVARARGMTQIARETGFAREALYRALSGTGNPELGTVIGVLKSLNMTVRVEPIERQVAGASDF
ncbi:addiction module antidote protein [Methylobacterium trifolii]|uniref:Addiction module antidote protein n=1 Tax=Methylobacterium trifolii TaxID=1003092 RepID=A0ABQ4TWI0_9HYPH|nr:addiction module antidote protein [Methylobacterium trifolii]GJE59177.1 hypothetical protein MPOCJGCO_1265 [Methylobacterium trifolii]